MLNGLVMISYFNQLREHCRRHTRDGLRWTPASYEVNPDLFAQQKQTNDRKRDADDPLPRRCFVEKQNACERHDRGAASKDCRNGGQRTAFLEKKEKRDRSGADANAGKQGIIKTSCH